MAAEDPQLFVTDSEVLQELLHRYLASGRRLLGRSVLHSFAKALDGRGRGLGPYLDRIADYCATEDLPDLTILVVLASNGKPSTGNTHADVEDEQGRVLNQIMWPQHPRFAP